MEQKFSRVFGLDLSKKTYHQCMLFGPNLQERKFSKGEMNPQGRKDLAKGVKEGDHILLEAGSSSFTLARYLMTNTPATVTVLNPADLHIIFKTTCKTDKKDSMKIADLGRRYEIHELPTVDVPTEQEQAERSVVSQQADMAELRTAHVNRLHARFNSLGYCDISKADLKDPIKRIQLCKRCFKDPGNLRQAQMIIEHMELCEQHLAEIAEQMRCICLAHPREASSLLSIFGFGLVNTATFIAFLGDCSRFSHPRQVCNYAGITPRIDCSGQRNVIGGITHMGNRYIRRAIVQGAWAASKTKADSPLKRKYKKLVAKGKPKQVAAVAVARKMLTVAYTLVRSGELYRPMVIDEEGLIRYEQKIKGYGLGDLLKQ